MKFKYFILLVVVVFSTFSVSNAADFYPELGMDPFYSSLNPMNIEEKDDDSILDIIKSKKDNKNNKVEVSASVENFDVVDETEAPEILDSVLITEPIVDNEKKVGFFQRVFKKEKKQETKRSEYDFPSYYMEIDDEEENKESVLPDGDKTDKDDAFVTKKKKNRGSDLVKEIEKEEKEKLKALQGEEEQVKEEFSFKNLWPFGKDKNKKQEANLVSEPELELSADHMEYFPERYEVEAVGNAKIEFKKQDVVLSADKLIFNYDKNILKASDNVILLSKGAITEGDFIRLDLSKPEGWFENPITKTEDIVLKAKEAFVYSDRIEEYDGVAKILKDEKLRLGSKSFAGYINQTAFIDLSDNRATQPIDPNLYALKARTIYIDSKEEHEVITIKNADLYFKNKKVATIPSAKIVSNKANTNIETNLPEFGSMSRLGAHIGPSVVLNVPGGSTLKLSPVLTYSKDEFGLGAIGRFRSENNMTEAAYGTSREEFLLRGKHKIAPGLTLNYSRLTNQSEWFLGYRRPKYSAGLNYRRSDYVKDLDLYFSQMYIAGVVVDDRPNQHLEDLEGRFRWMTQTFKPIYSYKNEEGNIAFSTGLVAQTAATIYTGGEVTGLFRVGPAINTKVGPWKQSLMYYQTAIAGKTPFDFDRYRYGRSNVVLIESLKVCKYLSLGYLASLAMNREVSSDDLFQENRILVSVGPEYAKVTIGYDAFRRNTMFLFSMMVGTKDSDIEFKKSVLKNPEKFGKEKKKSKKSKKKDYKKYLKEDKE